jgi:5-oxoprolinase (ATP-hydrolysing) subunit A
LRYTLSQSIEGLREGAHGVPRSGDRGTIPHGADSRRGSPQASPFGKDGGVRIDLNADLGEDCGADDAAMLDVVSSANIACGFHAGGGEVMAATVESAAARGVAIGAHVSYRDREHFGRRALDVAAAGLAADVAEQLASLGECCARRGTRVRYVKPHGALYHAISRDRAQAEAVVQAIAEFDPSLPLLGLPGTVAVEVARTAGLTTLVEAFADRAYASDGGLVPRESPGSVLDDPELVAARMLALVRTGRIAATDGTPVAVSADSLCVHGDSPNAVAMARAVRDALAGAGIEVVACA